MKKIILAVVMLAVMFSGNANAFEMFAASTTARVSQPEHRVSLFGTITHFPNNASVDKYETAYRPALEFKSDSLSFNNFFLVPGVYYAAIGIDKSRREYTINPAVAGSLRYNLSNFIDLSIGYGTNGGDKSGPIYSGKFEIYKFKEGAAVEAGMLFTNIGEPVNSYLIGASIPFN